LLRFYGAKGENVIKIQTTFQFSDQLLPIIKQQNRRIIAFWGPQSGCGTTVAANTVAALYSLRHRNVKTTIMSIKSHHAISEICCNGIGSLESDEEVVFLDCGCYRSYECFKLMHEADIVVVNLSQDEAFLNNYVLEYMRLFPKAMILVGNCYTDFERECTKIENKYRIGYENMGIIPANEELAGAYDNDRLILFMYKEFYNCTSERNRRLLCEVSRFTYRLEQQMEQVVLAN
jgi:hypothetical protein